MSTHWQLVKDIVTLKILAAALIVGSFATPTTAGNLWPPRSYEPGLVAEWNALLVEALPSTQGVEVPRYYALMHIAMYDAVSSIEDGHAPIHARVRAARHASSDAAAAQAAHDVLAALLPSHKAAFDFALATRLASINPVRAELGVLVGREVARRILDWDE
ncbi:MAG TPA: hypothetical protein VGO61_17995 [Steroidobacteraceae bacterium]|nr:hypothetical protein [Steroidobacteraceae bacterium]